MSLDYLLASRFLNGVVLQLDALCTSSNSGSLASLHGCFYMQFDDNKLVLRTTNGVVDRRRAQEKGENI